MRISLIDKFTTLTQRIAARGHAAKPLNQARFKRQQGATAIEYAIIAALVTAALFVAFGQTGLGSIFTDLFAKISTLISGASTAAPE
ncbi:pilus assembly protein Flp/PilA [Chromohalobacter marismortui]|uniref:Pilus assembly protein Flp/PilA n=1 Tax=Chromohalobacter marismortui TaxID=42055 RepID=A0A4R7NVJ5_9GAMM|nr:MULTISPECIES: Flp family type IVb pilin [Chromohalobacter]MCI0510318.1 Flp family type IVb pilin [Chromohalobacter sp.]MCI0594013.1 Flp family type IVb pilin [Chromohalobacter sp.]TDU25107.1 pilus assembly protein Flp/PilA [Chromohalobacter marismortui]